jgi:hypothetical protein
MAAYVLSPPQGCTFTLLLTCPPSQFIPPSFALFLQVLVVKATMQIVAQALVTLACIGAVDGKLRGVPPKAIESMNMAATT